MVATVRKSECHVSQLLGQQLPTPTHSSLAIAMEAQHEGGSVVVKEVPVIKVGIFSLLE